MRNSIAIELILNEAYLPIAGLEDISEKLKQDYIFQAHATWRPASESLDAITKLLFNTSLVEFLTAVVAGGIAWDAIKIGTEKFFLRPFFNQFNKLLNSNENFRTLVTIFQFNDINIEIIGKPDNFSNIMSQIIEVIIQRQDILFTYNDLKLYEIVTPLIKDEDNNYYEIYPGDKSNYLKYWGLKYKPGFNQRVLNLQTNEVVDKGWSC